MSNKVDNKISNTKEFVVVNDTLWVREIACSTTGFSPEGKDRGRCTAVQMRPATQDEVIEYQEECQKTIKAQ